jgi:hypothetical protein
MLSQKLAADAGGRAVTSRLESSPKTVKQSTIRDSNSHQATGHRPPCFRVPYYAAIAKIELEKIARRRKKARARFMLRRRRSAAPGLTKNKSGRSERNTTAKSLNASM